MKKGNFVGFGLGPIQIGLFLYEAYLSGNFKSFTIAEVDEKLVESVNRNNGLLTINIAYRDRVETVDIDGIRMLNPLKPEDRNELINAVSIADEIVTSLPSVLFYSKGGDSSVANIVAAGLKKCNSTHQCIVYTAENNNHAAEILYSDVLKCNNDLKTDNVQFLNTVIGKMSCVVEDKLIVKKYGLRSLTPDNAKTVLVESFNKILISKINFPCFRKRINVFEEKFNLMPFEEAKLYGHNAIHLLLGLLADERGCQNLAEAGRHSDLMGTVRKAFIEEAGKGLINKYNGFDELFTEKGFMEYADDLLERMTNPLLSDPVSRVIRDLKRKIEWNDRLIGSARLAIEAGVNPTNLLLGVQLAQKYLLTDLLHDIWPMDVWVSGEAESFILPNCK